MKRMEYVTVGLIVVLALLSVGLGSRVVRAQSPTPTPSVQAAGMRSITVGGEGQAGAQPDQATVRIGVQTDAPTAAAALSANNQQMQSLLNAMRQLGVAASDIQTQQVQLSPRYENPSQQGGTPQLAGYTAINIVEVRTSDLNRLGSLLDAAVGAGGNRIEGIQFAVRDMSSVQADARQAAWNDAVAKGQQLAQLAGGQLGQVLTISETSQVPRPVFAAAPAVGANAQVPVEPGTQMVTDDLQVTWALVGGSQSAQPATTGTPSPMATGGTLAPTSGTPSGTPSSAATPSGTPSGAPSAAATPSPIATGGALTPTAGTPGAATALPQPTLSSLATGAPTPSIAITATSMPLSTGTAMPVATAASTALAQPTLGALATGAPTSAIVSPATGLPLATTAPGLAGSTGTPSGTSTALPQPTLGALATMAATVSAATAQPQATMAAGATGQPGAGATTAAPATTGQPEASATTAASPAGTPSATSTTADIIVGLVNNVDPNSNTIRLNGERGPVTVMTTAATRMLDADGGALDATDIRPGDLLRADGSLDASGRLAATRVQRIDRSALQTVDGRITGKSADGRTLTISSQGDFNSLLLTSDASATLADGRDASPDQLAPGMSIEATGVQDTPGTLVTYHVSVMQP